VSDEPGDSNETIMAAMQSLGEVGFELCLWDEQERGEGTTRTYWFKRPKE
jgi:hypothetical protein